MCPSISPDKNCLLLQLSHFSRVRLCLTPWTAAHQAPLSLGFSRQEQWSGLPLPSPVLESEVKVKSLSRVRLLATPWTAAHQAPLSMGFSRQEYWSGVPLPSLKKKKTKKNCLGILFIFPGKDKLHNLRRHGNQNKNRDLLSTEKQEQIFYS